MNKRTREDYLRVIYHLQSEKNRAVKNSEIALFLKIRKPSVTQAIDVLEAEGYIEKSEKHKIALSSKGISLATNITKKHRILENFLSNFLKMDKKVAHKEAHELEHSFTDDSINKIYKVIGKPKKCPHGKEIPQENDVVRLDQMYDGDKGRILFSKVSEGEILERISSLGILPDTEIKVLSKIRKGPSTIRVKDSNVALGNEICSQIYVRLNK